jgi:vancomycin aglycone glucosyltransferase
MPAAAQVSRTLVEAARAAGARAILSQGWADLGPIDGASDCIAIGDVSHQSLFPRVAAVVHHGGAGTTAAAARAGAPQVLTPMFGDQFYWAQRICDLGAGAATPADGLSVPSLTAALEVTLQPAIAARAADLARQVDPQGAARAARRLIDELG